jgi:dTDP-4-amino-4,6-dideoxygalactose transaminase
MDLAFFCAEASRALAAPGERRRLATLGGRTLFPTPRARDGLTWLLERLGIGPGHEVAVPTLICESVADTIAACGATPVTFGVDERDFAPSLAACQAALSPATRAVVLPHLYGVPADLDGFRRLCDDRGCVLIEDCAPCVHGERGGHAVGSVGDGSIYSFQYDKPLALGWGGALSLSPAMLERLGPPAFPEVAEGDERFLAAALLVQHGLTDAARLGAAFLDMGRAPEHLLAHSELVDEVLAIAGGEDAARRLGAWCEAHVPVPKPGRLDGLVAAAKRRVKRFVPAALRRLAAPAAHSDPVSERFKGRRLAAGGLCEHLLAAQERELAAGPHSAARARIAAIYQQGLDRERMVVPEASCSPRHWLRFPLALRRGRGVRDRLCVRIARELGIEVGPYTWPTPVHRVPRLHGLVRVGPGSEETASLTDGLLNLPVHHQVTESIAHQLVEALNRA